MNTRWKTLITIFFCVPVLLFSGCSFFGSDSGKLKEGFYREIIMEPNGHLIGKLPISDSEAKKGGLSYKVEMGKDEEKGKVKTITAMYGEKPVNTLWQDVIRSNLNDSFSKIEITYDEDGMKYDFKNTAGESSRGFYHANAMKFKLDEKKQVHSAYFYDASGKVGLGKGLAVAQALYKYDENGRISEINFMDENGTPAAWAYKGGSSVQFKYEDDKHKNLPSNLSWHNDKGDYANGPKWCEVQYTYDEKGRLIKAEHKGVDGQEQDVMTTVNFSYSLLTGPEHRGDNWQYFGKENIRKELEQLRLGILEPGYTTEYTYDEKSIYPASIRFTQDLKNKKGLNAKICEYRMTYDENGNIIKLSSHDESGQPTAIAEKNIDTVKFSYDNSGNIAEKSFFTGENSSNIMLPGDGLSKISKIQYQYDDQGRVINEAYFDMTGGPGVRHVYGAEYSKLGILYEGQGKTKLSYYGKNGEAIDADPLHLFYGTWRFKDGGNELTVNLSKKILEIRMIDMGQSMPPVKGPFRILSEDKVEPIVGGGVISISFDQKDMLILRINPDIPKRMSFNVNGGELWLERIK